MAPSVEGGVQVALAISETAAGLARLSARGGSRLGHAWHTGRRRSPGYIPYPPLLVDDEAMDEPDVRFVACRHGNRWFQGWAEVLWRGRRRGSV